MKAEKKDRKIEILAPAGSMDSLRAAIGAGADAVYMGGSRFGARAFADNPDREAMLEAIDYAHLHGRKLYMTVNTLLREEELKEELYHYLKPFYLEGLDAVIVQDMGVLRFVSREFPGLPIHVSTQMSLVMPEGVRCFEGYPVTRVVNARELGLSEIRRLREGTELEIESFVHGALCYCYSGQCLMSSMIGGRSGNRGRCAQPCRMEYRADGSREGAYLLSPKDICTLDRVVELVEAGIDSFKIEGRMKRYEYAAGVAAAYRTEVDRYLEMGAERYERYHKDHPQVLTDAVRELQDLYNRGGFSDGYYHRHNGRAMMSMLRPNHSGVAVGNVRQVRKNRAVICCSEVLNPQDILEIRRDRGALYEFTLGQGYAAGDIFEANFTPGLSLRAGDLVYRTKNQMLLERISEKFYEKEPDIYIGGRLEVRVNQPMKLYVYPKKQPQLVVCAEGAPAQTAQRQPVTREKLETQIRKTGDTAFVFQELEIITEGDVFVPVSQLNELRRSALAALRQAMLDADRREKEIAIDEKEEGRESLAEPECFEDNDAAFDAGDMESGTLFYSASVMTREQLEAVLESGRIHRIYYDLAGLPAEEILQAAQKAHAAGASLFVRLPKICREETYRKLLTWQDLLLSDSVDGYLIQNLEELSLFRGPFQERIRKKDGKRKTIISDAMLYTMNREAKSWLSGLGVQSYTVPYELNRSQAERLGVTDMEWIIYGRVPLMTSAQCIFKNTSGCLKAGGQTQKTGEVGYIEDRKNAGLPYFSCCKFCYSMIWSADCVNLTDCLEEITALKPKSLRYDFTTENASQVRAVLDGSVRENGAKPVHGHFHRGVQ